jgi:hypothetical protein
MGVELSSEADHARRIEARRAVENPVVPGHCKRCRQPIPATRMSHAVYCSCRCQIRRHSGGLRARDRCKRCQKAIPETRRKDAIYCSQECSRRARWDERFELRTEIRATVRILTAPKACACGAVLDNRPGKRAPVAKQCAVCRSRKSSAAYRVRNKDELNRKAREKRKRA